MKVICVDDEQLALDFIEHQIRKLDGIEIIGKYIDPLEAEGHILTEEVDVVFLDIQLPSINGIALAERLMDKKPELIIVFVTAYDQYAVEAFELNAIDYLVKPVKNDRLKNTLERIHKELKHSEWIKDDNDKLLVKVSNNLTFEVEKNVFKPLAWRTTKTQELFLYLLQHHGQEIEKTLLTDLLWGEIEAEKGYSLLYTTIYNVRKALKPFGDCFVLHNKGDCYFLELQRVSVDLFDWEKDLFQLPELTKETVQTYERVARQNEGIYLKKYEYIWLEAKRHRLNTLWLDLVDRIAVFYNAQNNMERAVYWYGLACDRFPEKEELHFTLMKAYDAMGVYEKVKQQYEHLQNILQDRFASVPCEHISEWYEEARMRQ